MNRFAEDVWRLSVGGRVVLWHARTGRHVALSPAVLSSLEQWMPGAATPPGLQVLVRRLDQLHFFQESVQPDLSQLRPARARRVLLFPAHRELWLPLPRVHTTGGFAYASRTLSDTEVSLWRACNGSRTVARVAEMVGTTSEAALAFFAELTDPRLQALQLRDQPISARNIALLHLVAADRPPAARPGHLLGPAGETTLEHYHVHEIVDGETHFDDRETTIAHAFAVPHPALGGARYGARLHAVMSERGLLPDDTGVTLEIGPGDGELGESWLEQSAKSGQRRGEYLRLDQSPELLRTQKSRQPGTAGILGTATDIPLPDGSVQLVICNEVIADLTAVPHDANDPDPVGSAQEVAARMQQYCIPQQEGRALYNLGAWKLLEELSRILKPGGVAWLSEFGGLETTPEETLQLDHPEVSIHFGHLCLVARALGLKAECVPLASFMEFDLQAMWLSRHSHEALRARFRSEGSTLRARAWTPQTLPLPWPVEGLEWVPVSDNGPGPLVTRFMALLLRKPFS